ncbi:bifunctional oligoribonuclease/PAP phosphatase NrnA [uncultured Mitsuokella sp.]|uniref:DHH family phosphoesterase n=1 Tax=uncultured Mitsuokella sp. TaxID=453120 RepID=UPI0025945FD9|nr:bifunctional oligoribonuclease/PAP phosphatase NrnA [uncultured Mitsuokella sp.]
MIVTLSETAAILASAQRIVITAHQNPDGDAIGSSLGLMHILRSLGKEALVLLDDDIPAIFSVLPGYDVIRRPDEEHPIEADILVVLDTATDRTGCTVKAVKADHLLNIDHHQTNDGSAEYSYIAPTRAATAEIIYDLMHELPVRLNKEMAMCIYTGLATDSGFFRFSNTTSHTMRAAAELLDHGVEPNVISEALEQKPYQTIRDIGEAIGRIELFADGHAAGIFLDAETTARMKSTEAFIGMIRVIEGVDIAVVLKTKEEGICRVSMRSKGLDVSAIAVQFGGGGHRRAAGCTLLMSYERAKRVICEAISKAIREAE